MKRRQKEKQERQKMGDRTRNYQEKDTTAKIQEFRVGCCKGKYINI